MELLSQLPSEMIIILGGLAISSFTQACKYLQDKTGYNIFLPKNLAATISVLCGVGYAVYHGGNMATFSQNVISGSIYAWWFGQGAYSLYRGKKK